MFRIVCFLALVAGTGCDEERVSREMGARCSVNDDCEHHCLTPTAQIPGGMCTTACNVRGDCLEASECVDLETGFCLYACGDDQDCDFLGTVDGEPWSCQAASTTETQSVRVCLGVPQ